MIVRIKEFRKTRETNGMRGGQEKGRPNHAKLNIQCGHAQYGDETDRLKGSLLAMWTCTVQELDKQT